MIAHISEDGLKREESVAEHTEKTRLLCDQKGKRCGISQLMSLCAILHDMGKNKRKFDEYLRADEKVRQKLKGSIAHASTGAKYVYDLLYDDTANMRLMTEMISYASAAHHGLFDCVDPEYTDRFSKKLSAVDDYDEACRNAKRDYLDAYDPDRLFAESFCEFQTVLEKIKTIYNELKPALLSKGNQDIKKRLSGCRLFLFSCLQRLMLSILIDSDWEATSDFMENVDTLSKKSRFPIKERFEKAGENFASYMRKKQQSINISGLTDKEKIILEARNALQEECRQFAKYPAGIYCLPVPTGGGKTLGSLAYALEYCRLHPETERVIYVSPYISVTEQNAQVFREAIGNGDWILEHHSSVIRNERADNPAEDEDYKTEKLSRYDINWEEPFICTTFVQFMNTLFSDKSESVRRMHRLVNAVVIIDEVQSMPLKCVHTFNYMINFLNKVCNTDIILCTATQPALAETECPVCYGEPQYMIKNVAEWFYKFERVKIHTPGIDEKYTFESLGDEILERTAQFKSILVVLNTKSAVRKLYDILKARGITAEYLTTNLCAEHRSDKIKSIKKMLEKKQEAIVVISTNLIEAGVDISFECVYRSMAGLDSLAQTAGRCNRNGELEYGTIRLLWLEGENDGNMEELQQNKRAAESVLYRYENSDKQESLLMPGWMEQYYRNVYCNMSETMNFPIRKSDTNILELLSFGFGTEGVPGGRKRQMNQAYKTAGREYRVIDDDSFGVIVPYKKGAEIIEAIQTAADTAQIKTHIRNAQRYTVNVRGSQLKKFSGLIQAVSDSVPGLYMAAAPGSYSLEYGITPEWEPLIF